MSMTKNLEDYRRLAPRFHYLFEMRLMPRFWNHMTRFNVMEFEDAIAPDGIPDGVSLRDFVNEKWGNDAVRLLEALMSR